MRLAAVLAALLLLPACSERHVDPRGGGDGDRRIYQDMLPGFDRAEGTKAFGDPAALAFAANGDLWVGNYETSTIARYAADQIAPGFRAPAAATVIEGGAIKGPNAMVFDAHGYLWVAMYDGDRVAGFTPEDLVAGRAPSIVLPDPGGVLRKPAGVALDSAGNLWVANSGVGHLVRYPRRGGLEAGTARPDVVLDVANDECQAIAAYQGRLWLGCADSDVVYVYPGNLRSGKPAWDTRLDWKGSCGPVQLATTPDGRLAAACYHSGAVSFLERGQVSESYGIQEPALANVHGIAFDATGNVWAGTNRNVILAYPEGQGRLPVVVLRPRPADVVSPTPVQVFSD
ncbi:MAG TPA: hypothetical protein VGX28_06035 [Frankiaceae bacterium]|jgi:streptogramin lyase|nr:hypothetical protein [Frankiaceae bacterium]